MKKFTSMKPCKIINVNYNIYDLNSQDCILYLKETSCLFIFTSIYINYTFLVYRRCKKFPVIGMDCEWTPVHRKKEKPDVALLQIATNDGFCILLRTCFMTELPHAMLVKTNNKLIFIICFFFFK